MQISKNGRLIDSVESWFSHAPPKEGLRQWKDGRSAKELAKAFCISGRVTVPSEVEAVLASNPVLGPVHLLEGWPEHKIALDSFRGETRNADLASLGGSRIGTVAVTIEAKADEPFGKQLGEELDQAARRPRSNVPQRIKVLANALFGLAPALVSDVRYQLVHATAATLIFAAEHHAAAAVFLVVEFHGSSCTEDNLLRNANDLNRFVSLFQPHVEKFQVGLLAGPFEIPGNGRVPKNVPLFIGKVILHIG